MHDLVLRGGRVIDPASGTDAVADVAFSGGLCAGIGTGLEGRETRDVTGCIVTPGLIDLHTHVYWGGTSLGVDPEDYARSSAVTTMVDTGSAGPGNFAGFLNHVIRPASPRILALLHVSFAGIFGFGVRSQVGESHDPRLMAPREAVEVARAHPGDIAGIKVRVGFHASGPTGIAPLEIGLQVAEETGLPLMVHIDEPPPSYEAVVSLLRPGDILTHAFRPFPNAPVAGGGVRQAVLDARARGVLFDIGHGQGSFSWETARAMLANGFAPDTISSDVHAFCIEGPAYDLLRCMTKFLALGLPLGDVIAAASLAPAEALRRPDLGRLAAGLPGDASVIALQPGEIALEDVEGRIVTHDARLVARGTVLGGAWRDAA
ncbi:amidohydrolase/deacetylase family metallohydrolase [Pseudoroseicyclus aestuarii]|uniref:Dihydroorotase n=1 Tax=Pseudoroseicyclus aestuarii TaxID=1795041 RepID=A0A318SWM9_9RHOB|nr:amidohydrolase/deacetylase family metallohydrolase [Pseudoroseicyclus aestuarii]PYE85912.1 dihydroorotase [Pseudoroseicyclus aestuarii]